MVVAIAHFAQYDETRGIFAASTLVSLSDTLKVSMLTCGELKET